MKQKIAIAGAGFAGAVIARELAETGRHVTVFDERSHVAGNCFTERDATTQVMVHRYGPHIFHTNRTDVWEYVNRFSRFLPYTNRVKAVTAQGVFSLPINLLTINQFFGKRFGPAEAQAFIAKQGDSSILEPKNFEEQALKMVGRDLYEAFFYGYTKKQWGVEPTELPASILQRLPLRFNYDDNYYNSRYQGIPVEGYTPIVQQLLDHPDIEVFLNTKFQREMKSHYDHVFFSGPLDAYFGYSDGRLRYRTLFFEAFRREGDFQGNPVINYCEPSVLYTRITEHKHFTPSETHTGTVCFKEYSKATEAGDVPYYPLRLDADKTLLGTYVAAAEKERNVTFIGRLGTYRYLDMHMVIGESLDLAKYCKTATTDAWPVFGNNLPSSLTKAA